MLELYLKLLIQNCQSILFGNFDFSKLLMKSVNISEFMWIRKVCVRTSWFFWYKYTWILQLDLLLYLCLSFRGIYDRIYWEKAWNLFSQELLWKLYPKNTEISSLFQVGFDHVSSSLLLLTFLLSFFSLERERQIIFPILWCQTLDLRKFWVSLKH